MKREILTTKDGSTTIHLSDWNESYHSRHGAIQEAKHVFIKNGLHLLKQKTISIMEIGFGTGLNCFITYLEARKLDVAIHYVGIEAYPITESEIVAMNYVEELNAQDSSQVFDKIHSSSWEESVLIAENFSLVKKKLFFQEINDIDAYDLIYFDAFGYDVQPELWSTEIFRRMFESLRMNGLLVTYAARGVVKRSMIEVGFKVSKVEGPPGKREMFIARKVN